MWEGLSSLFVSLFFSLHWFLSSSFPTLVLLFCWPSSPPLFLAALCSTDGSQAGKDPVKLAPSEAKKQDRAVEARGGAQLPAPGHSLWSTASCLCCIRKKLRQKLQLMSGMALPFLPTSASSHVARAAQLQVWRQPGDLICTLLFYFQYIYYTDFFIPEKKSVVATVDRKTVD